MDFLCVAKGVSFCSDKGLNIKLQGIKYNYDKGQVCFCKIIGDVF
jgi:hypothetical protein